MIITTMNTHTDGDDGGGQDGTAPTAEPAAAAAAPSTTTLAEGKGKILPRPVYDGDADSSNSRSSPVDMDDMFGGDDSDTCSDEADEPAPPTASDVAPVTVRSGDEKDPPSKAENVAVAAELRAGGAQEDGGDDTRVGADGGSGGSEGSSTAAASTDAGGSISLGDKTNTGGVGNNSAAGGGGIAAGSGGGGGGDGKPTTTCSSCAAPITGKSMRCSRCKQARYCNRDCQRNAWKQHKRTCIAVATTSASTGKLPLSMHPHRIRV